MKGFTTDDRLFVNDENQIQTRTSKKEYARKGLVVKKVVMHDASCHRRVSVEQRCETEPGTWVDDLDVERISLAKDDWDCRYNQYSCFTVYLFTWC